MRRRSGLSAARPTNSGRWTSKGCFETFPHAIVCAFAGKVVPAKPKKSERRKALRGRGYDDSPLSNIDSIDAALCAVTAEEFHKGRTISTAGKPELRRRRSICCGFLHH